MKTIARNLVRVINHQIGLDDHEFTYELEDPRNFESWKESLTRMLEKHGIEGDAAAWHGKLQEKANFFGEKAFSGHFENGWLISIRHDRIEASSLCLHANDNDPITGAEDAAKEDGVELAEA